MAVDSAGENIDRRETSIERRKCHPLLADWRWAFNGRRKSVRRHTDFFNPHVVLDWYHPSLLFFILATYVMSGVDAVLTLSLLNQGITVEANPLMNLLMAQDVRLFVGVKTLVTGLGLVGLAVYSNLCLFMHIRIDRVIYVLFTVYALLITYEITLLRMADAWF